jgi:hypothetical protein
MTNILSNLGGVVAFFDDILVTGSSDPDHLRNLVAVFQRLKLHGLRLKKDKCLFFPTICTVS